MSYIIHFNNITAHALYYLLIFILIMGKEVILLDYEGKIIGINQRPYDPFLLVSNDRMFIKVLHYTLRTVLILQKLVTSHKLNDCKSLLQAIH